MTAVVGGGSREGSVRDALPPVRGNGITLAMLPAPSLIRRQAAAGAPSVCAHCPRAERRRGWLTCLSSSGQDLEGREAPTKELAEALVPTADVQKSMRRDGFKA